LVYNGTIIAFYPNNTVIQKVVLIQIINNTYPNGSILVCNIFISLNSSAAPRPSCSVEDPISPLTFYYINPNYLGKDLGTYQYLEYKDGFYIYIREGSIEGVTIRGVYYFDNEGIARRVEFYQYSIYGSLVSYSNYTLWITNIDNPDVTIPKINYSIVEVTVTLSSSIIKLINLSIISSGSIAIIIILLIRRPSLNGKASKFFHFGKN